MPYDIIIGSYTSLSNSIWLDVARSHIIMVAGKRGSGKSYTIGVIAEELSNLDKETAENIAPLIFDTMGIFWTMKFKNDKELELLEKWNLKPKNLPVKIWVPYGKYKEYEKRQIPIDEKFAIKASELNAEDWITLFNLSITDPISVIIEKTLANLEETQDYDI